MSLASIWTGRFRPLPAMPLHCRTALGVFGFPILFLIDQAQKSPRPRVFTDDHLLAADLTLGEVIAEEMDLVVPDGSVIVICNPLDSTDPYLGVRLASEVVYKLIAAHNAEEPLALFRWSFQSLATNWLGVADQDAAELDQIFSDIVGLPRSCSDQATSEYLAFLAPDLGVKLAWSGLGYLLAEQHTAKAGYVALRDSFAAINASVNIGL